MSGWLRLTVTGRVRSCSSAAFARVTSTSSLFSIRRMAPAVSTWKWSGTHHVRSRGTSASRRLPLVVRTTISAAAEASSTTAFTSPAWCGFGDQLRSCCRQSIQSPSDSTAWIHAPSASMETSSSGLTMTIEASLPSSSARRAIYAW